MMKNKDNSQDLIKTLLSEISFIKDVFENSKVLIIVNDKRVLKDFINPVKKQY